MESRPKAVFQQVQSVTLCKGFALRTQASDEQAIQAQLYRPGSGLAASNWLSNAPDGRAHCGAKPVAAAGAGRGGGHDDPDPPWQTPVDTAFVALGANLPGPCGSARATLEAAVTALAEDPDLALLARSAWVRSRPVPPSGQPDYINGVVWLRTRLAPTALLARLHEIEARFGRRRSVPNAARTLDLDILDHGGRCRAADPSLPHPRLTARAFVLVPLAEIAPTWRHPETGIAVHDLIAALPADQVVTHLPD